MHSRVSVLFCVAIVFVMTTERYCAVVAQTVPAQAPAESEITLQEFEPAFAPEFEPVGAPEPSEVEAPEPSELEEEEEEEFLVSTGSWLTWIVTHW